LTPWRATSHSTRNKSFFASFFSKKEESSFSEEKEAKRLLFPGAALRGVPGDQRGFAITVDIVANEPVASWAATGLSAGTDSSADGSTRRSKKCQTGSDCEPNRLTQPQE
jgi:hypothetical protein